MPQSAHPRPRQRVGGLAAAVLWLVAAVTLGPQNPVNASETVPANRLTLRGGDGAAHGWEEFLGADGVAVCFAFLHPACPLAQEYAPVLEALSTRFADARIHFIGVVCECDAPGEVEEYRTTFGITFPIHLDTDFALAEAFDATTTPEVVLVDRTRRIRVRRPYRRPLQDSRRDDPR
jgi:hypothetical protein